MRDRYRLSGDGAPEPRPALWRGDELHAGAAARLLAEDARYRVGQPGDEPGRGFAAARSCQGRLADAERDRRRGVVGGLAANAPASARYAVEVDDHEVSGPFAVHPDNGVGQGGDEGRLVPGEPALGHACRHVWHSESSIFAFKKALITKIIGGRDERQRQHDDGPGGPVDAAPDAAAGRAGQTAAGPGGPAGDGPRTAAPRAAFFPAVRPAADGERAGRPG